MSVVFTKETIYYPYCKASNFVPNTNIFVTLTSWPGNPSASASACAQCPVVAVCACRCAHTVTEGPSLPKLLLLHHISSTNGFINTQSINARAVVVAVVCYIV